MPTPSSVKIDNVPISDVTSVEFGYETPTESGYLTNAVPHYGTIELIRLATDAPLITFFKLATNEDGAKKTFDGEIQLVDSKKEPTYTAKFKNAFIERWSVSQTAKDARGQELIVLRTGELTFHAGPKNKSVNFENYLAKK
jgi:hypothetical protein